VTEAKETNKERKTKAEENGLRKGKYTERKFKRHKSTRAENLNQKRGKKRPQREIIFGGTGKTQTARLEEKGWGTELPNAGLKMEKKGKEQEGEKKTTTGGGTPVGNTQEHQEDHGQGGKKIK